MERNSSLLLDFLHFRMVVVVDITADDVLDFSNIYKKFLTLFIEGMKRAISLWCELYNEDTNLFCFSKQ